MKLVKTRTELLQQYYLSGLPIEVGFVPTMGALHQGHLALVKKAVRENPIAVVSIFVNPTQFNDPEDLKRYPRTLDADLKLLEQTGCYAVFAPQPEEIYPKPDTRKFDFGRLEEVMEGKYRPGHFNGVAQVVSRLFEMVMPRKAYFGLKDFQQFAIVKEMVRQLYMPVKIVPCNTVREKSGLAMSSRNELLTNDQRTEAALIYQTLRRAKKMMHVKSISEVEMWVRDTINNSPMLNVEYFEIVDSETLQHLESWNGNGVTGCIAVHCGAIRLIDNIRFK